MKIRIVEHVFADTSKYYTVQKKVLGLFWVSFIYECDSVTVVDRVPTSFDSYYSALDSAKEKLSNSIKNHKNYFYISAKDLV